VRSPNPAEEESAIRSFAIAGAIAVLGVLLLGTYVVLTYIPEGTSDPTIFLGLLASSILASALVGFVLWRLPDSQRLRVWIGGAAASLVLLPIASTVYPGRITYDRFGLTVYGLLPIPYLDVTINRYGVLWFRTKTHEMRVEEVQPLVTSDVEIVVIGIGWDRLVRVDPAVRQLAGGAVEVLATPDAFARYNQLRNQGRRVVLLAHTTC
jgi:hypothetical protein